MSWRERAIKVLNERVILLVGWLCFMLYAYPGYMSADSVWQLVQGRTNELNDWHPPMMAFIWRYLDKLLAGPLLMLVLQSGLFLAGLYSLLCRVISRRVAAFIAVFVLLLPTNIVVMSVIWKDSQMAGFALAATAALLSEKRGWRIAGYALFFFATAVRYNAALPILPLIVVLFDGKRMLPWFKRYPAALGLWLAVTGAAFLVNSRLTDVRLHVWPVGAASVDIAGTLRFANDVELDRIRREVPDVPWLMSSQDTLVTVRYWYRPQSSYENQFEGMSAIFRYPQTDAERKALGALWWQLVREHPGAFYRHRRKVFVANLKGPAKVWDEFTPSAEAAMALGHHATHSPVQRAWASTLKQIVELPVFRPRLYWWLSLILIFFTRRSRLAFALFASGIVHELGLFAFAPSVDYRYNHWLVVTTIVGTVVLLVQRLRSVEGTAKPASTALVPDAP